MANFAEVMSESSPIWLVGRIVCCPSRLVWVGRSSTYLFLLVWFSSAQSLVVVPSLSLVLRSVVLGVALSGKQWCSPRCRSFGLRASSLLRATKCDETVPQYVISSRDSLDFEWGVLCSKSRNRCLALDGRIFSLQRSGLTMHSMASFVAFDAVVRSSIRDRVKERDCTIGISTRCREKRESRYIYIYMKYILERWENWALNRRHCFCRVNNLPLR